MQLQIQIRIQIQTHTHTHTHIHIHVHVYIYIYICIYTYMSKYIYIYIYTTPAVRAGVGEKRPRCSRGGGQQQARKAVFNVEFKVLSNPNQTSKKKIPHQLTVEVSSSTYENILRLYSKGHQGNHNS